MRFTLLENSSIALASLIFGIMAGFFWTYSFNINLATAQLDGATYAITQSLFNENVRHAMFFFFFFGGAVFSVLALILNRKHWKSLAFLIMTIACLSYVLGIVVFTSQVNLPLNAYTESWDPQNLPADWQDTRAQWNNANAVRVATSGASFVLALVALLLRASSPKRN